MAEVNKGYAPLQERIRKEGRVLPGNIIKIDGFLNHRVDMQLMHELSHEFIRRFDTWRRIWASPCCMPRRPSPTTSRAASSRARSCPTPTKRR